MSALSPAELAEFDQQLAQYREVVHGMVGETRAMLARVGTAETVSLLVAVVMAGQDELVVRGVAATALVELRREPA